MSIAEKLSEIGVVLPPAPKAIGAYRTAITTGNLVHLSGHLPVQPDGSLTAGRVESDADIQTGYDHAKLCGLAMLATLQDYLGDLAKVKRVVKILGMVNCSPDFVNQPKVINGCSELFSEVFGLENGVGVRSAVGVSSLPLGVMVEIEGVFEIECA